MLTARVDEVRDGYVIVLKTTHSPLYPKYIRVSDANVVGTAYIGCIGRLVAIGGNQYKFYTNS